jgi:hypothetical protein
MTTLRKSIATAILMVPCAMQAFAQSNTGTTSLNLTVAPEANITVVAATPLASASTVFGASFTGSTNFTYKIRTSTAASTVTVKITTDFSTGTGGKPSVASPPTAGDALTYTCAGAGAGTPCSTSVTASTSTATSVWTFGATTHNTNAAGDTGTVSWSLTDDPVYPVNTYAAVATFTISAS